MPPGTLNFLFGELAEAFEIACTHEKLLDQTREAIASRGAANLAWCPYRLTATDDPRNFTAYLCMVARINILNNFIEGRKAMPLPDAVVENLRLWEDSHIRTCVYLESLDSLDDATIKSSEISKYLPSFEHVFHEGELPDFSHCVQYCDFFGTDRSKEVPSMDPDDALFVRLASKALPRKCKIRSLGTMLAERCKESKTFCRSIMAMFRASMIGSYRHSKVILPFNSRKELAKFFDFGERAEEKFINWVLEHTTTYKQDMLHDTYVNQHVVFFVLKEYLVFCVDIFPPLKHVLCDLCNWGKFWTSVVTTMDKARGMMATNMAKYGISGTFSGLNAFFEASFKATGKALYRIWHLDTTKRIVLITGRIDAEHKADELHYVMNNPHEETLRKVIARYPSDADIRITAEIPTTDEEIVKMVHEGVFPLRTFFVSAEAITSVSDAMDVYRDGGCEKMIKQALEKARSKRMYDYCMIKWFFNMVYNYQSVRLFPLPLHYLVNQTAALYIKYKVQCDGNLPPTAGKFLFCRVCKTFCGPLASPTSKVGMDNVDAFGNYNVLINEYNGKRYCGCKKDRKESKKSSQRKQTSKEGDEFNKMRALTKQKIKEALVKKCSTTELEVVELRGNLLMFYKKMVLMCPKCAIPTMYDRKRYSGSMYTCGCCVGDNESYIFRSINCLVCKTAKKQADVWTVYKVYDDTDPNNPGFTNVYVCPNDDKLRLPPNSIQFLSVLDEKLKSKSRRVAVE